MNRKKYNFLILTLLMLFILSCTFLKIIYYGPSNIDDYKIFPFRRIAKSRQPFTFTQSTDPSAVPELVSFDDKTVVLDDLLTETQTVAFLVLSRDTLICEKYFSAHTDSAVSYSFSMAKSFTSLLIGCAIADGLIQSVEQPVTDFVPELKERGFDYVLIKHLLQMTSGMAYREEDNPFGLHPHFYYGSDLESKLIRLKLNDNPGRIWSYKSGENQLLGLILSRALLDRSISEYMQDRLWQPLGMEHDALWSIDDEDEGLEKTFCCLAAAARDFLKIGRLCLHKGNWNGNEIIPPEWIEASTRVDSTEGSTWFYQYQWWLTGRNRGDYYASGHRGQFLYIDPVTETVILRLGKKRILESSEWIGIFRNLADILDYPEGL